MPSEHTGYGNRTRRGVPENAVREDTIVKTITLGSLLLFVWSSHAPSVAQANQGVASDAALPASIMAASLASPIALPVAAMLRAIAAALGGSAGRSLEPGVRPRQVEGVIGAANWERVSGRREGDADGSQADDYARFPARLTDGAVMGELVLGETTFEGADVLYSRPASSNGTQRPRRWYLFDPVGRVRRIVGVPTAVYTFWRSSQTLIFNENNTLVALLERGDPLEGLSLSQALDRFPGLRETARSDRAPFRGYEMQAEVSPSVSVVLFFTQKANNVVAAAYVWKKPVSGL